MSLGAKPKKLDQDGLWEYALKTLDRRAYAAAELRQKLSVRAETPQVLQTVMRKLSEYGLVDDSRFAESFATSRLETHGHGAQRVMRELRVRRVPPKAAEAAVRQVYGKVNEAELAARFLEKKFRTKNLADHLKKDKNLAAAYRRLRTAGFSAGTAIKALKRYTDRADEIEEVEEEVEEDQENA